jgi:hypothetical protein
MPFKKGNRANPKGRPLGAKSKVSETFYDYAIRALNDERLGGYEGFVKWITERARHKEIYFSWLAKWAEKQIKEEKVVDITGEHKLIIEIVKTNE